MFLIANICYLAIENVQFMLNNNLFDNIYIFGNQEQCLSNELFKIAAAKL